MNDKSKSGRNHYNPFAMFTNEMDVIISMMKVIDELSSCRVDGGSLSQQLSDETKKDLIRIRECLTVYGK